LLDKQFDAPGWVIPGLLPVGLTILAAPPKTGKSLLALGLVLKIAHQALDQQEIGGLYLSLDDPSERRLQTRVLDILDGRPLEDGAWFSTSAATLDSGLCAQLDSWLRRRPHVRIVVIDALGTVKAKRSSDDVFKSDYSGLRGLQDLALAHGIAVLLVHHTRKMPAGDDWVNRISGTLGIAAMADALWLLHRPRGSTHERLLVTSRDAPDTALEVPLDDLLDGEWQPVGEDQVKEVFLTDQVLAALQAIGIPAPVCASLQQGWAQIVGQSDMP
jgi:RecA-family ATPase